MLGKFVILMDGAFVKKKIQNRTNKFPTVSDIKAEVARIRDHPEIRQKGVDLYMGLDIARLSLRRFVDVIVVVSGDSDLVPAFKFARHEGIRVYLDHLGHTTRRELKANTDLIL